ncbi:ATP-dependent exonuclease [Bifidobacterium pseudolongum subsp. globosum]|uniref:hypothetical protein n=1 Tax=Bifidobacterium pseudolongum TaxID=1694 RepID=UPI00101F809A|nr:hypothetical protein [Bifidobacterium pseudolongum]RYQ58387.1 ATP-dependent exonuclease [Bifidobacterium pseudolongum subsp. globosum]
MNDAIVAVAGWGKTEELAKAVAREQNPDRILVLTYTETNQREDTLRIFQKTNGAKYHASVIGWKAFQLRDIVRPYLPLLYPGVHLRGLSNHDVDLTKCLRRPDRYLTRDGDAYPSLLGKLALDVINSSKGAAIRRLEWLYDSIYIDEAQDLRGNDLCVLEKLLKSNINVHIFLDPRQSTLNTAEKDPKYKKDYPNAEVIKLYREWERKGLLHIRYENVTHRSIAPIAAFSDVIVGDELGLGSTVSTVEPRGWHDGIYIISKADLSRYVAEYDATLLALQKSKKYGVSDSMNFRKSKGMTRDDVVIVTTGPIEKFLTTRAALKPASACNFYVAVTRAKYSVALAVENPHKVLAGIESNSLFNELNIRLFTYSLNEYWNLELDIPY